jgi:predicted  nucleic acid-binding Zn-ribbon protein
MATPVTPIFRTCHRLRKLLRDLQAEIDLGPRVLKAKQDWLTQEEAVNKEAHEAVKRAKLKLKDDEITLKQTETALDKHERQLFEVTTMKEIEAKRTEIANAKAKIGTLEDAILVGMSEIEERTANLAKDDKRWADAKAEFKQFEIDGKERYERLLQEQKIAREELAAAEASLPAEVRPTYDRLVKTHGPNALAAVVGKSCQQCRANITEQQLLNLKSGLFMVCPTCGRALYPAE